jgi:hypothetical protein
MIQSQTKVGLVVDRNFGPRVTAIARAFHVWTVQSPTNTPCIDEFWRTEFVEGALGSNGISGFLAGDDETPEQICARIAEDVDIHHDHYAEDGPWAELHVFGVQLSDEQGEVFKEIGAASFESTPDGVICRRIVKGVAGTPENI